MRRAAVRAGMGAMRAHTHKHTVWRPRTSPRAGLIRAKDLFGQFDLNGDGKVSKKEFCLALAQIDLDLSPEELSDASRGLDVDGDGTIDYEEMELRQRASRKSRHGRKSESRTTEITTRRKQSLADGRTNKSP